MSKVKKSAHSSEDASSSSGTSSSLSSDEEVDVRDLKPIKDYLSDRRELARQLFKSVKPEKIQMMLPQVLKKMDLGQLEEWCANELSGMSKARILCILNGKTMVESSDTTESDDSGPSLEIISDTEEWFTDEEMSKKEEGTLSGKGKVKKDRSKLKGKSQLHKKTDNKVNSKKVSDNAHKIVQIKKEEGVDASKEKEGDSLLDLLELEMRARAIRALIRKEEDIIPSASKSVEETDTVTENNVAKIAQDEQKEKENCRRQLERIISAQQSSTAEDEDVVLVVQPTPTIELLSSDSEGESHNGIRVNKKLQNERVIQTKGNSERVENRDKNTVNNVNSTDNSIENKVVVKTSTEVSKEVDAHKTEVSKRAHSNNVDNKDTESQSKSDTKRRKTKKKSRTKERNDSGSNGDINKAKLSNESQDVKNTKNEESLNCNAENVKLNGSKDEGNVKSKVAQNTTLSEKQTSAEVSSKSDKTTLEEEKAIDLDEIIDLDDYCDDMDDIENNENDKKKIRETILEGKQNKSETNINTVQKLNGTETWASRYYQTDDVQNVIKESKIQSEIRKRLRERQRLSKLNTPSNTNSPLSPSVTEATSNKIIERNPLGSVDEYLALKHTAATSLNTSNSSSITLNNGTCTVTEGDHVLDARSKQQNSEKSAILSNNTSVDNLFYSVHIVKK